MSSTAVIGVSFGLGLVFCAWLIVRRSERKLQQRKMDLLRERIERRQAQRLKEREGD